MAHIADCLADVDLASTSNGLPSSPYTEQYDQSWLNVESHTPRKMQPQPPPPPPAQHKRYQLFPRDRQLPALNNTKVQDVEKVSPLPSVPMDEKPDKTTTVLSLKTKITQHSLVRRRKISVPELGPMTTVQEIPMDSPTIPGRPPVHERSASAPADDGRQQQYEMQMQMQNQQPLNSFLWMDRHDHHTAAPKTLSEKFASTLSRSNSSASLKHLAPLVIPSSKTAKTSQTASACTASNSHCRSESGQSDASKPRVGGPVSSMRTPCTPSTSTTDLSSYSVATNQSSVTLPTPTSAAPSGESHSFHSKPWEIRSNTPTKLERSMTPQPVGSQRAATPLGHRRGASESSSLVDRGRPRMRPDAGQSHGMRSKRANVSGDKLAKELKAFEELPRGFQPKDVAEHLTSEEVVSLHKQAYGQAERFEVLKPEDVESLSKELRQLDERTTYLRQTYTSLRAGRRNLHSRICQFLRSPRVARFSYESMLKQEEALAELDASIDDWVTKLEMAENRHMRVRQKLLEHVAGAAILSSLPQGAETSGTDPSNTGIQSCTGMGDISTPPRSPTKPGPLTCSRNTTSSPSPQRVVAQVPSTILENPVLENTIMEEVEGVKETQQEPGVACLKRSDVESIRIYAGDDIATLLADVEKEITRLSRDDVPEPSSTQTPVSATKELHRKLSHDLLSGTHDSSAQKTTNQQVSAQEAVIPADLGKDVASSPPPPTPPMKDYPMSKAPHAESEELLSNATFKP